MKNLNLKTGLRSSSNGSSSIFQIKLSLGESEGTQSISSPQFQFYHNGNFTATGSVSSDRRLKENIQTLQNSLDKILALQGVSYKRNDIHDSKKYIGLIAQDVQAVLPEIVNEQNDLLSVEYTSIIPVIIESIKELYELIPK